MSDNRKLKRPFDNSQGRRPFDPSKDRLADLFMVALGVSVATIAVAGAVWIIGSLVSLYLK